MPQANIQFPVFALKTNSTQSVLIGNLETANPVLPLFFSAEMAFDFTRRHRLDCTVHGPMSPKLLYDLLQSASHPGLRIIFDPVDLAVEEHSKSFDCEILVRRFIALRDKNG